MTVMFFLNCVDLLRTDPDSCSETCLIFNGGENHVIGIKVKEFTDIEEEGDSHTIKFCTLMTKWGKFRLCDKLLTVCHTVV